MVLDLDFVIYSTLLVLSLIPLYIYRERIFKFKYKNGGNFDLFIKDLKLHMQKHHPKIPIDYSIIGKTIDEKNLKLRETLIVENVVQQFFYFSYDRKTQKSVPREKLWQNYEEKSISNVKMPSDWIQRKELAYYRDNKCCNRCGDPLPSVNDAYTIFIKEIEKGGGYNLENIAILCSDCNKILNSKNEKQTLHALTLNDKLLIFSKN